MTGWQWFWTLVGFIVLIIVLIFLYFYQPFEDLFRIVVYGLSYDNVIFWAAVVVGIVGFCTYHWHAYRLYIVEQHSIELMVLASLRGSTVTAILLTGGAALQTVQIVCVHLLEADQVLNAELGQGLAALIAQIILTAVFCVVFWLLKVIRSHKPASDHAGRAAGTSSLGAAGS